MSEVTAPTVGQLVQERPRRAKIFEKFSISYCSSGKKSLEEACERAGVHPQIVLEELHKCDSGEQKPSHNWGELTLTELSDHIESTHHVYLRSSLPRLAAMLEKVERVHGNHHPELHEVKAVFDALRAELEHHMIKEEQVLFPLFRQLENAAELPEFHCGTVRNPIAVMEHEHSDALNALARMNTLTSGYTPPEGVCATYCATLDGLAEFEEDLRLHIHKEDDVLFPKGAALEQSLSANAAR